MYLIKSLNLGTQKGTYTIKLSRESKSRWAININHIRVYKNTKILSGTFDNLDEAMRTYKKESVTIINKVRDELNELESDIWRG